MQPSIAAQHRAHPSVQDVVPVALGGKSHISWAQGELHILIGRLHHPLVQAHIRRACGSMPLLHRHAHLVVHANLDSGVHTACTPSASAWLSLTRRAQLPQLVAGSAVQQLFDACRAMPCGLWSVAWRDGQLKPVHPEASAAHGRTHTDAAPEFPLVLVGVPVQLAQGPWLQTHEGTRHGGGGWEGGDVSRPDQRPRGVHLYRLSRFQAPEPIPQLQANEA